MFNTIDDMTIPRMNLFIGRDLRPKIKYIHAQDRAFCYPREAVTVDIALVLQRKF